MKAYLLSCFALFLLTSLGSFAAPLGLPKVPIPSDNPQSEAKIKLGDKLFHEKRFSSTGEVSCSNCHVKEKTFTDGLKVSEGIKKLRGTRNAPTVVNAAYFTSLFWDGREPSLERQATQPFLNPVEMNLPNHDPILKIVRRDPEYAKAFKEVFGKVGEAITINEVTQAIAAFERTLVSGESPFDRWYFGAEKSAISPEAKRGFEVFLTEGRCVSHGGAGPCFVYRQQVPQHRGRIHQDRQGCGQDGRRLPAGGTERRERGYQGVNKPKHLGAGTVRSHAESQRPGRV